MRRRSRGAREVCISTARPGRARGAVEMRRRSRGAREVCIPTARPGRTRVAAGMLRSSAPRRGVRWAGGVRRTRRSGMQHRGRVAVDGRVHPAGGAHPRVMPTRHMRRHRHATYPRRVVPAAAIPRCRVPVRHNARRRNGRQAEDGHTGRRVAVHRPPIVVAVDGEPVRIVAGVGPCGGHAAVRGVVGSPHRPVPVVARGEHHGGEPQDCSCDESCFHICFALK